MNFVKTIISVFSFQVIQKLVRQLNSIILARCLGPANLGIYLLFIKISQNIFTFSEFGMGASGIYHIRRKLSAKIKVIENSIFFSIIIGIVSSFLLYYFRDFISFYLLEKNSYYVFLLSLLVPLIMISSILSILVRGMFRFDIFNIFLIIKPFTFLIFLSTFLIFLKINILNIIYAHIFSIFISALWILYKVFGIDKFRLRFHPKTFLLNFKYGIKNHILKITLMVFSSIQVYILKFYTNNEVLGQYSVILSIIGIVIFVKLSISLVLTPKASEMPDQKMHNAIAKVARNTFFITIIASLIIYFVGSFYISFFYGREFLYASDTFMWFIPGVVLHSTSVMLHRDFTYREKPAQYKPIIAYSIGILSSYFFSIKFLEIFNNNPLMGIGIAFNISHFISFLILLVMFKIDTGIKFKNIIILTKDDVIFIKKNIFSIQKKILKKIKIK